MENIYESLLLTIVFIAGASIYLSPIVLIWWYSKHADKLINPPRPEWVYGMDDGVRFGLLKLGLFFSLFGAAFGASFERHLQAAICTVATVACAYYLFKMTQRRRGYEKTYEQGTTVLARVVKRNEESLRATPGLGGGVGLADDAAVARGAAMILRGPWKVTVEFELDGQTHQFERRISSQAYYRYARSGSLPILVRAEQPDAWIPRIFSASESTAPESKKVLATADAT